MMQPTHCIYLEAVRVLDRSYIAPEFAVLCARQLSVEVPRTPTRFSPKTALTSFRLAQKKFPHVRSVLLKDRSDDRDDVYDMHRIPGSDRFNVYLETRVVSSTNNPPPGSQRDAPRTHSSTPCHEQMIDDLPSFNHRHLRRSAR